MPEEESENKWYWRVRCYMGTAYKNSNPYRSVELTLYKPGQHYGVTTLHVYKEESWNGMGIEGLGVSDSNSDPTWWWHDGPLPDDALMAFFYFVLKHEWKEGNHYSDKFYTGPIQSLQE